MSDADTRPAVPAKAGDFVELRCGVIAGPLCENDEKVYTLGLGVINEIGRICTWCADGRAYDNKDQDQADIVAIVPRPTPTTEQHAERRGGVQMRVGGRYRLRNGNAATCDKETVGGAFKICGYDDRAAKQFFLWLNNRGKVFNDDRDDPYDVIAEVTDDATSEPQQVKPDDVNHPKHYTSHPSGVECIAITEHFRFNVGNAIKYLWRAGLKTEDPIMDLEKAAWYVAREIQRVKGGAS